VPNSLGKALHIQSRAIGSSLLHKGASGLPNQENHNLGCQSSTAVKHHVAEYAGSRWQEALTPFIETRNESRVQKSKAGPPDTPSRANSREADRPGTKQENAECEITHKVAGLAQQMMQNAELRWIQGEEK